MAEPAPGNIPELSVSELSFAVKRTVEDAFPYVRLRGEISGYRGPHSSGHCYFALKDEKARIDAIIWKGVFGKLRFKPEEGLEVMCVHRGGQPDRLLTSGPARLAQALAIDSALNGADLCTHPEIFIEWGVPVSDAAVARGPRVGVRGDEQARTRPWRFWIKSDT